MYNSTQDSSTMDMTSTEDYSSYYETFGNNSSFLACNNGNVMYFRQAFIPTLYSIVFIVGVIGNSLVVFALLNSRRSSMTDVCLLNLAVSDLLFLISLPFWAYYAAASEWTLGNIMCRVVTGLYMLGLYGSIFFMIAMTFDRYIVIVHAQASFFTRYRSVKGGTVLAILMWSLSLLVSLPEINFTQVTIGLDGWMCKPEFPEDSIWSNLCYIKFNIFSWVLPLSVILFCYSRIIPILLTLKSQKRHKAVRLILVLVAVFIFFWTPFNIVIFMSFLQQFGYMVSCMWNENLDIAMQWMETIAFSHCCLNPIIYAFVGQKFRNLVLKILKQWFPICFSKCATIVSELSERRSSVYSRSSDISSTKIY